MLLNILHISYLNDIREADSRAGCSLTNSWWSNSFCTKPTLPRMFDHLPWWYNFLSVRFQIRNYRDSLYTNCSRRVKFETVSNNICGSNGSFQHADPSLGEKASLREQRMTQKNLHTCHCPLHYVMINCNPNEGHSKDGMQLWGTLHH